LARFLVGGWLFRTRFCTRFRARYSPISPYGDGVAPAAQDTSAGLLRRPPRPGPPPCVSARPPRAQQRQGGPCGCGGCRFLPAGLPRESPVLFSACIIRIRGHMLLDRQNLSSSSCQGRDGAAWAGYYCRGGDFPTGRGEARWSVHLDRPAPGSPMDARHHRRSGSASCPHPSIIARTANGSCRSLGMSTVRGGHGRDHRIGTGVVYRYCVTHAGPPAILASAFWRRDAGARLAAGRWPGGYSSRSSPPASSPSFSRGRGPWDGRLSLSSSLKDANVRLAEGVCDLPRSSLGTRAIGDQGHDLLRDPVER
jgi:hypothetical protein